MGLKKDILNIAGWVVSILGLLTVLGFVSAGQKQVKFTSLEVHINADDGNFFIVEEDIEQMVYDLGYTPDVLSITEVDIAQIERLLRANPSIKNANVYSSINGAVRIDIEQRNPIIRVFNESGESYYIDETGWLMPPSSKYTSRVMVATGKLNEPYAMRYSTNMATLPHMEEELDNNILQELYRLASFVNADPFWKAQIMQVHVLENNDLELTPRVGNHTILLGSTENIEEKFNKLRIFYDEGLSKTGWNEYTQLNLKFANQVVATK